MFDSYTEPDPNAPREGDAERERFYPKNLVGHSILLWVNDHIQEVPGAINADSRDGLDVTIVDLGPYGDPNAAWGWAGVHIIWQANSLIGKLKQRAGNPNPIVIYVGKGTPAQKGWQAPFILTDVSMDPMVRAKAEGWMNQNPGFVPNPPRQQRSDQPAGPPQPQPYPQPAPAPSGPASAPPGPAPQGYSAPGQWPQPQPGWTPGPSSAPPNGFHGQGHPYPAPASGSGQPGWTGSPEVQPSSSYEHPSLLDPGLNEYEREASERLARAHKEGRNATLDSLRQRHGIPQPQPENPPF